MTDTEPTVDWAQTILHGSIFVRDHGDDAIEPDDLMQQREWSAATFGPGTRLQGVLDHIRKELAEVEADPLDISEWADLLILVLDGALRQGFAARDIIAAYFHKRDLNKRREWPDWRTQPADKAIEHVRPAAETAADRATPPRVEAAKPAPLKVKSGKGSKQRRIGPLEWVVIDAALRDALADGETISAAALAAGISPPTAKRRIESQKLYPTTKPTADVAPPSAAPVVPKPAVTPTAAPKPAPAPSSEAARPSTQPMVSVLGARRRIQSLYAIGYDMGYLTRRAPGIAIGLTAVMNTGATEINPALHDAIDKLWLRLRYSPVEEQPGQVIDRDFPPPGAWSNIDDPNERPEYTHRTQETK